MRRFGTVSAMVRDTSKRRTAEALVGKLVQFDKRVRRPKARPLGQGNAQIVFFTGVRYERDGTPLPGKPLGTARSKRKRG
jgi:hypothetical protein